MDPGISGVFNCFTVTCSDACSGVLPLDGGDDGSAAEGGASTDGGTSADAADGG